MDLASTNCSKTLLGLDGIFGLAALSWEEDCSMVDGGGAEFYSCLWDSERAEQCKWERIDSGKR